jgi:hypothetical protein
MNARFLRAGRVVNLRNGGVLQIGTDKVNTLAAFWLGSSPEHELWTKP